MMHGKNVELLLQKTHQVADSSTSDEPLVIFAQQNKLCPKFFVKNRILSDFSFHYIQTESGGGIT